MRTLLLAPFHERSFRLLADLVGRAYVDVYLPLPVEVCVNPALVDSLPSWFSSYIRVWEPLLVALRSCSRCVCYSELGSFEEAIDVVIKILALVYKARVFNKIDPLEWVSVLPSEVKPSAPCSWSGVLVIDDFKEYVLLRKRGVRFDHVVRVEDFTPSPLELLFLVRAGVVEWSCGLEELIKWVVEYLGDLVLHSGSLTEVYDKLRINSRYLGFITACSGEIADYLSNSTVFPS